MTAAPLVSAVIPTLGRPTLLLNAIRSVLAQTYHPMELIVVVDGPDVNTVNALQCIRDDRVRVVINPCSLGAAAARNRGVAEAAGSWVAFLDDDDEWMPEKIDRQMSFACGHLPALWTCRTRVNTPLASYIWPDIIFDNSVPFDDYLFDRRSLFMGDKFVQTSSYLIPKDLFDRCPFPLNSPHDDWEFIIRLTKGVGARVETVPDVLVLHSIEEIRPSLSNGVPWSASLNWLDGMRPLLTPRAYSGICLGVVGPRAAASRAYRAFFPLLRKAFACGTPTPLHVLLYLAFWSIPQSFRRRIRAIFQGIRRTAEA
jgi:glycosyltransferase involved in cell wall biosynthesis